MTTPLPADIEVRVLRTYDEFMAVAVEWQDLHAAAERPTPYQHHGWLKVCWNVVWRHPLNRLRVVLVRRNGQLVMGGAFVLGWRRLRPIVHMLGSRTPEYEDLLWRAGPDTLEHVGFLLAALRKEFGLSRQLKLDQVLEDSPLLAHAAADGAEVIRVREVWRIPLHQFESFEAYYETLSRNLKVDHRRQLRKIERLPQARLDMIGKDEQAEIIEWTLARKRAWLTEVGKRAEWLTGGRMDAIYRALLNDGGDGPELWASVIRAEGRIVAGAISMADGGVVYYSKITHDPDYHQLSPARTLTLEIVREAVKRGMQSFDLGQGNGGWKQRFGRIEGGVARSRINLR